MESRNAEESYTRLIDRDSLLSKYDGPDRVVAASTYLETSKPDSPAFFINEDLPSLDMCMNGFAKGEVTTIAGYTGNGKTLLARTLCVNAMKAGFKCLFLSYEVNPKAIIPKDPELSKFMFYLPLELRMMNVPWLIDRIHEAAVKYGVSFVFIDHLHFIIDMSLQNNMSLNIGATMRTLQRDVAIGLNMSVFILAHTQQPNSKELPTISNIRDSSFIAQESPNVLIVHRVQDPGSNEPDEYFDKGKRVKVAVDPTYDQGHALVIIEKARRSGVYKKKINVIKKGDYLVEL